MALTDMVIHLTCDTEKGKYFDIKGKYASLFSQSYYTESSQQPFSYIFCDLKFDKNTL